MSDIDGIRIDRGLIQWLSLSNDGQVVPIHYDRKTNKGDHPFIGAYTIDIYKNTDANNVWVKKHSILSDDKITSISVNHIDATITLAYDCL